MPRRYDNPPLIESVIEYRFLPSRPWDLTVPGLLYPRVQEHYPKIEQDTVLNVAWRPGPDAVRQEIAGGVARIRFQSADGSAALIVAPDILAISRPSGYPGWDRFREEGLSQLENYRAIGAPVGISRVGLRYVNKIQVGGGLPVIELNDYFRAAPNLPEPIPQVFGAFLTLVQVVYPEPQMSLRFSLARGENEADALNYVLDLDISNAPEHAPDLARVGEWLDIAHARLEEAFDAALTEKTHAEVLREVK